MPEDVIYVILDHLHLKDMVNTFKALPTFILAHGVQELWRKRMDRTNREFSPNRSKISWEWVFENERALQNYDVFIFARNQGDLKLTDEQVVDYLECEGASTMCPNMGQSRQMVIWGMESFRRNYGN